MKDEEEEVDDEPWPASPVQGAQELLRFSRIRQPASALVPSRRKKHGLSQMIFCTTAGLYL